MTQPTVVLDEITVEIENLELLFAAAKAQVEAQHKMHPSTTAGGRELSLDEEIQGLYNEHGEINLTGCIFALLEEVELPGCNISGLSASDAFATLPVNSPLAP
ncbi:hypothetical protein [Parasedimentitalea maritima]|uniref:Uncharacterized protein n=1 Tax=Parasedimentitalea maritima TaxID=2578117 RepID=A0A6A4RC16_9RHOB|nr:hypothetical protein [Zongyanglinia marina]KAE9627824.1 hypothetical protein GP644_17120 [Zongyanglinia marina]